MQKFDLLHNAKIKRWGFNRTVARVFNFSFTFVNVRLGGLYVCAGGLNAKTLFIYCVSYFSFGGLGAVFARLSPPKPFRGDGIGL